MKFLANYLYFRRRIMIVILTVAAVFVMFMALYGVPIQAILYSGTICAVITAATAFGDFWRYVKKYRLLCGLQSEILLTLEHLPSCDSEVEEKYQLLLETLHEEKKSLQTAADRRYDDAVTYFMAWAHQIKTPIAAMSLLLQGADTSESRELSGCLLKIEQYVEMALCYIHMDSSNSDFVIQKCQLDNIIKSAVRKFSPQFIRLKIKLIYEPADTIVLTDGKWLQFVIEQVISNALKYTKSGSVQIALLPDNLLSIRDTGIGISPEDLPRIFERGFTGSNGRGAFATAFSHDEADNSLKLNNRHSSTGIGLYLCKRICRELGHEITIQSNGCELGGTEVLIRLTTVPVDTRD